MFPQRCKMAYCNKKPLAGCEEAGGVFVKLCPCQQQNSTKYIFSIKVKVKRVIVLIWFIYIRGLKDSFLMVILYSKLLKQSNNIRVTKNWLGSGVDRMFKLSDSLFYHITDRLTAKTLQVLPVFRGSSLLGWWIIPQKNSATITWTSSKNSLLPLLWWQLRRHDSYDTGKFEKLKTTKFIIKLYFWKASEEKIILKQKWTKSDYEQGSYGKKELWLTK